MTRKTTTKTSFLALPLLFVALFPTHQAVAQSPEMPEPIAIVVDADGKPMVQVVGIPTSEIRVLFNFDGVPAAFTLVENNGQFNSGYQLYFSNPDCTGDAYVTAWSSNALDVLNQQNFVVAGPDATTGTYRVFRSTSITTVNVTPQSSWDDNNNLGLCGSHGGALNLLTAEEIIPNPLDGFHGPTTNHRERLLTIQGGTRLP